MVEQFIVMWIISQHGYTAVTFGLFQCFVYCDKLKWRDWTNVALNRRLAKYYLTYSDA